MHVHVHVCRLLQVCITVYMEFAESISYSGYVVNLEQLSLTPGLIAFLLSHDDDFSMWSRGCSHKKWAWFGINFCVSVAG